MVSRGMARLPSGAEARSPAAMRPDYPSSGIAPRSRSPRAGEPTNVANVRKLDLARGPLSTQLRSWEGPLVGDVTLRPFVVLLAGWPPATPCTALRLFPAIRPSPEPPEPRPPDLSLENVGAQAFSPVRSRA